MRKPAETDNSVIGFTAPSAWDCFGALLIVCIGSVISAWNILSHLTYYANPPLQRNIVRILIIAPLYGIFSWLSLVLPTHFVIFDAVRDVWEAVVIYCFLALVMDYAGGELACAEAIQRDPGTLQHVFPLSIIAELGWIDKDIPLNPDFLKWCRRAALQFVVIKPTMAIMTVWIYTTMSQGAWAIWSIIEVVIYNIAYSVALYALVMFYLAIRKTPAIQDIRPLPKFVAVKVIVFATYWQSLLILILCPNMPHPLIKRWNSFVLCIECPLTALLQAWAFPGFEFMSDANLTDLEQTSSPELVNSKTKASIPPPPPAQPTEKPRPFLMSEQLTKPLGRTWKELQDKQNRKTALKNARHAFGVGDVMEDAMFSFKSRYSKHARLAANYEQAMTDNYETKSSEDHVSLDLTSEGGAGSLD